MQGDNDAPDSGALFISRQPIFDRDKAVWGYEISACGCELTCGDDMAQRRAGAAWLLTDGLSAALHELPKGRKALLQLPAWLLDAEPPLPPKEQCAIGIFTDCAIMDTAPDPALFAACQKLKDAGYTLVMNSDMITNAFVPLITLAEIMILDVSHLQPLEIAKKRKSFKQFPWKLMTKNISDWQTYEGTHFLGFSYFSGNFFGKPKVSADHKFAPSALARLQLLRELNKLESDMKQLAVIVSHDASLSLRLLKYINSPAFGLQQKVQSMLNAITLLGLKAFRQWAMVVLMADMDQSQKGEELSYLALQRARFLEQTAMRAAAVPLPPDSMFLLGMFSLLDAMMGQEMKVILEDIPLDDEIKAALCGVQNAIRPWIDFVEAVEAGNWTLVREVVETYDIEAPAAAVDYMRAATWARNNFKAAR